MKEIRSALSILAFMWVSIPGFSAASGPSAVFDLTPGDHEISPYFGYNVLKARIVVYHVVAGPRGEQKEPLGTLAIDGMIIYPGANWAGLAVSDDGKTLLYENQHSPYLRPSAPRDLERKPTGLYEFVHDRGDRLIYPDVNVQGRTVGLPRNSIGFSRPSRIGDFVRTTEGQEWVEDMPGWTKLHRAAFLGDVTGIISLLQEGAKIEAEASNGFTPLDTAISNGQEEACKALIDRGADLKSRPRTASFLPPIHHAAYLGHTGIVRTLVDKGLDVNSRDTDGKTPLHVALWMGKYETATYLMGHGADVNATDAKGSTPLHVIAALNLDEFGLEIGDPSGLKAADSAGSSREKLMTLLIEKGADVNATNTAGQTPLELAKKARRTRTVQVLLAHGAHAEVGGKRK